MRVVVDTNVIVSAAIKAGSPPYDVLRWIIANDNFLKSEAVEREALLVLQRPRLAAITRPDFRPLLRMLFALAQSVDIKEKIAACRDPDDDKFLELAVNGGADVIISGDADLLALHPFRGIPVETPAAFLRRVAG
jgi:putative PIN family toxin of toxin-antitoxin system